MRLVCFICAACFNISRTQVTIFGECLFTEGFYFEENCCANNVPMINVLYNIWCGNQIKAAALIAISAGDVHEAAWHKLQEALCNFWYHFSILAIQIQMDEKIKIGQVVGLNLVQVNNGFGNRLIHHIVASVGLGLWCDSVIFDVIRH